VIPGCLSSPADWLDLAPIDRALTRGWWIRLAPSGTLSATVSITEARIAIEPEPLEKFRFASTINNRILLASTLAQKDRVSLSRQYEEYGWTGDDSYTARMGAQDSIVAVVKFFDQVWLGKGDDWYVLGADAVSGVSVSRGDSGAQVPINDKCCVVAPLDQRGQASVQYVTTEKSRTGVYYLNHTGCWCLTTAEIHSITEDVSWFTSTTNPRIDLDYIEAVYGVYWPENNWVMWCVPMITCSGTSQTTNNAIIVYDVGTSTWLPYFDIAGASICQAVEYASNHPERIGQTGLFMGGYDYNINRLFAGVTTDDGTGIAASAETGWLNFGSPMIEKTLRTVFIHGTIGGGSVSLEIRVDGETTTRSGNTYTVSSLSTGSAEFVQDFSNKNITAKAFKLLFSWSGPGSIYGCSLQLAAIREWPDT